MDSKHKQQYDNLFIEYDCVKRQEAKRYFRCLFAKYRLNDERLLKELRIKLPTLNKIFLHMFEMVEDTINITE